MERLRVVASKRFGTLSPLRYPGGKAALAGLFADFIRELGITRARYVEPYAGGAGAGVALLRQGLIDHLVINDIDPAVHAFWRAAVDKNDQFIDSIRSAPLTIDEWKRQRDVYRASDVRDFFALGFAFFYLNRTNRSGVLNAGVIGGQSQAGTYRIDARFNRETLANRIGAIGDLRDQITVLDEDGRTVIRRYGRSRSTFLYIDPPYVAAGSDLYLNAFDGRDHIALSRAVLDIPRARWLLTYDLDPLVKRLYSDQFQCRLELTYSAHRPGRAEELLIAPRQLEDALRAAATAGASA